MSGGGKPKRLPPAKGPGVSRADWLLGVALALAFCTLASWLGVQDDAALDAATQASVRDAIERAQALDAERQAAQEAQARRLAERAQDVAWAARSAP